MQTAACVALGAIIGAIIVSAGLKAGGQAAPGTISGQVNDL